MKVWILENQIISLFKSRTSEIVWIYETSKKDLVKSKEIFSEFFELKRREFAEDSFNVGLEEKFPTYREIHNEINFIFTVCEKHRKIQINPIYLYLKENIWEKSKKIWEKLSIYNEIKVKLDKLKHIANFTIIGLFY